MIAKLVKVSVLAAWCVSTTAYADFATKETEIVEASRETIAELAKLRAADNLNSATAMGVIQTIISPSFDYPVLTRSVLGKQWRKTNEEQRVKLAELFQKLLEKTYASALAKFSDESIEHEPGVQKNGKGTVTVVVLSDGKKINIEYLLTEKDGVWNIMDVRIEKVSLLANYRRQFASVIRKGGVDELVALLESKT